MDVLQALTARGAVLLDHHFVYKSGKHGPNYINMDPLFPDVELVSQLCYQLSYAYKHDTVDTVVGAATGGIPLAILTAKAMMGWQTAVWADKRADEFVFERAGFVEQIKGKRVLIVEDLLNTGDTTKKIIALVREHAGTIVGVSCVCNRGPESAESLDVPALHTLSSVDFQVYNADNCPLCAQQVPIVSDIGHGDTFRDANPDYAGGYVQLLAA